MTDEKLRALERAFKESGSPDDELAYLRERVRQGESLDWESYSRLAELNVEAASEYLKARVERGELEQEKLELAAYCSHEPARVALGEEAPEISGELFIWVYGLERWGKAASVRAVIAAARHVLPLFEGEFPDRSETRTVIERAEAWLTNPTLVDEALPASAGVWWVPDGASEMARDAARAAWAAWQTAERDSSRAAGGIAHAADAVGAMPPVLGPVSSAVATWALGTGSCE